MRMTFGAFLPWQREEPVLRRPLAALSRKGSRRRGRLSFRRLRAGWLVAPCWGMVRAGRRRWPKPGLTPRAQRRESRRGQRQSGGHDLLDRHRLARPHARPARRMGRHPGRRLAGGHQHRGRRRRPKGRLDQQQRALRRPWRRRRKARRLARRVVRLPVPAAQCRQHQRRGRQRAGLQRHRRPAALQPHRTLRGLVRAGDDQGRAEDAHRPQHTIGRFQQRPAPGHLHRQQPEHPGGERPALLDRSSPTARCSAPCPATTTRATA